MSDSRRNKSLPSVYINGTDVAIIQTNRCLGNIPRQQAGGQWSTKTEVVYKKGLRRLVFLRRLRSSNVCHQMLLMF